MSFRDRIAPKAAKFQSIGDTVEGVVLELNIAPVPEFVNGRPAGVKKNADGTTFTQVDILLDTADGKKILHTGGAMFDAIADAADAAGLADIVSGHKLSVTYSGDGEKTPGSEYPPKQYTAEAAAANGSLSSEAMAEPEPAKA